MANKADFASEKILTISELTRLVKGALEAAFPAQLWVEGEVSNFTRAHSGHLYFVLKDENCQISTVMWRFLAERIPFDLKNGLQVVCKGRINVYEPRGQYQFQAEVIEPKGKGALQLAFEQLKEKLAKEGLFAAEHKKELPVWPKKVGIVTSPRGAAIVDILQTLERRFARLHVLIYPARVQGEGAAAEIVAGIDALGGRSDVDVVIVGRGGGSMEDLWAFNQEEVARAIFRCPIPVISAVGHEIDFTISDFVADIRASTPTAAAELVIDKEQSFMERIDNYKRRMEHSLRLTTQTRKGQVLDLIHHRVFQNFKVKVLNLSQRVDEMETRAHECMRREARSVADRQARTGLLQEKARSLMSARLQKYLGQWEKLCSQMHSLSPLNILQKGYALCWKNGNHLVRSIDEVTVGEDMAVGFLRGEFSCQVKNVDPKKSIEGRTRRRRGCDEKYEL